jgi:hypothetical protein
MSPANSRVWGPNRIADGQHLEPERSLEVPLDANAGCLFRLRAYYRDGQTGIFPSADLCEDYAISLGREPTFKSDQELPPDMRIRIARSATVWNRSGLEIDWIFVAGADEGQPTYQGVDRLGNDRVLQAGSSERIDVSDQRSCLVTVKAVYRGKQQSEEKKLDLCASDQPEIVMYGR